MSLLKNEGPEDKNRSCWELGTSRREEDIKKE
jgi:hypothetical protein